MYNKMKLAIFNVVLNLNLFEEVFLCFIQMIFRRSHYCEITKDNQDKDSFQKWKNNINFDNTCEWGSSISS